MAKHLRDRLRAWLVGPVVRTLVIRPEPKARLRGADQRARAGVSGLSPVRNLPPLRPLRLKGGAKDRHERLPLTAEQFEAEYAMRSNTSVDRLRELGRVVRPCDCGEGFCQGWKSVSREAAAEIDDPEKPWAR